MSRLFILAFSAALAVAGCSGTDAGAKGAPPDASAVNVTTIAAVEQPIKRFIRVSGTLTAQEDAEVAAEVAGRVMATPVERGSRVGANSELIRIAAAEGEAQAAEAQANAAQIEARLGVTAGEPFVGRARRPKWRTPSRRCNWRGPNSSARSSCTSNSCSRSRSSIRRRRKPNRPSGSTTSRRNGAAQQYQALLAARARVTVAQKALADTTVRSPFAGVVGERFVSVGDYVTRGTKVASVMRVDPLRVELTVPEQYVSAVATGSPVTFEVDAYPGETFTGQVRFVSPSVTADTRALTIEAMVPNAGGRLKPGFFATAQIEQAKMVPGVLVPAAAVRTVSGTARVFVFNGDRVEERIVTVGQAIGERVEITSGLKAGEQVVSTGVERLVDGVRVVAR